jgi:hypothetical protein
LNADPAEIHRGCELAEVALVLRWAAAALNPTERIAVTAWLAEEPQDDAVASAGIQTRQGIYAARKSGLLKMRRRLRVLGIRSSATLLSGACVPYFDGK